MFFFFDFYLEVEEGSVGKGRFSFVKSIQDIIIRGINFGLRENRCEYRESILEG